MDHSLLSGLMAPVYQEVLSRRERDSSGICVYILGGIFI
jgi:hypothetical protein